MKFLICIICIAGALCTSAFAQCDCSAREEGRLNFFPPYTASINNALTYRAGVGVDAQIRIHVREEGIHRLNQADLLASGVPAADMVGADVRMFHGPNEIAVEVSSDGLFGPGDSIQFFGLPYDSLHDVKNVYWLGFSAAGTGLRWDDTAQDATPTGAGPLINSHCQRVVFNDRLRSNRTEIDGEPWILGTLILAGGVDIDLSTPAFSTVGRLASGSAELTARTKSRITNPSIFQVRDGISSTALATLTAPSVPAGFSFVPETKTFSAADLSESPANRLVFAGTAPLSVANILDVELAFDRRIFLENGRKTFGGQNGAHDYQIDNVGPGPIALDVSDPARPQRLQNPVAAGGALQLSRSTSIAAPCLHVADASGITTVSPADIAVLPSANLAFVNQQADFLMIVPDSLDGATAAAWEAYREAEGLSVLKATTTDIFNEFGYGVRDPEAIRRFIHFARNRYQSPAPRYVMLVGDPNELSWRDDIAQPDLIPTPVLSTPFMMSESDHWFVGTRNISRSSATMVNVVNTAPELAIGRLPVNDETEFRILFDKTVTFENQGEPAWRQDRLFVADETGRNNNTVNTCDPADYPQICQDFFQIQNEAAALYTPSLCQPGKSNSAFLDSFGVNIDVVNTAVLDAFSSGVRSIHYMGEQSSSQWGLYPYQSGRIFTSSEAAALMNPRLPVVTMGRGLQTISSTSQVSIAEALLRNPNGGAAGVLAPTALLTSYHARTFTLGFHEAIAQRTLLTADLQGVQATGPLRYGDVFLHAQRSLVDEVFSDNVLHANVWLGDPALHLHNNSLLLLGNNVAIQDGDLNPTPGDDTDFGTLAAGSAPVVHTFTITNTGSSCVDIGVPTLAPGASTDFSVSGSAVTLPPQGSATFDVTYTPGIAGTAQADVVVPVDGRTDPELRFRVQGAATSVPTPGAAIQLTGSLNLVAFVGASATQSFTIVSSGTAPLTVTGLSLPTGFVVDWAGGTLAPGTTQTVNVVFSPTVAGASGGTIAVSSDAASGGATLPVQGTGIVDLPLISDIRPAQGNTVIEWNGNALLDYTLYTSPLIDNPVWTPVGPLIGSNGVVVLPDPAATDMLRFYRIEATIRP